MRWLLLSVLCVLPYATYAQGTTPESRFAAQDYVGVIALLEGQAPTPERAYLLGRAYQEEYQHVRALEAFAQADTMAVRVLRAQAVSHERLGQVSAAIGAYRRALDQQPESVGLAMALARVHSEERQYEAARLLLEGATEAKPETPTIRVEYAKALVALDSLEGAIVQLEIAHRQAPTSVTIPLLLSQVYLADTNPISARRVLERALAAVADNPRLWTRHGAILQQLEAYGEAVAAYGFALVLGDSTAGTWRGLGINRYLDDDPRRALDALQSSYAADSSHARTAFYLGLAHKQLDAFEEAERWLTQAATLSGRTPLADIYEHLADAQRFQNDYRAAIRTDEVVLFLSPGRLSTVFHLGVLYDEYYADAGPAIRQYETFVQQAVASGVSERADVLVMMTYAQNRIRALRETTFFEEPSSASAPRADSSGTVEEDER
ncbi:MAG: tetratricopeptide repeat protein [Bacteroidota bacterium]